MMKVMMGLWLFAGSMLASAAGAQHPGETKVDDEQARREVHPAPPTRPLDRAALEQRFRDTLAEAVFHGTWQMTGEGGLEGNAPLTDPQSDKYTITKATKIAGDRWLIMARVQYGDKDVTLPIPVRVVWAGDTPIITLDEINMPGLGIYSARVMVYRNFYGGTWFGDCYGGILSGRITNASNASTPNPAAGPDVVNLVPNFTPGSDVYIEIVTETETTQKGGMFGDEARTRETETTRTCRRAVTPTADGGAKLIFTFDRLQEIGGSFMGPAKFDTDLDDVSDEPGSLESIFLVMLGRSFTLDIDRNANTRGCVGIQSLCDDVEEHATGMFVFAQKQAELTDGDARFTWGDAQTAIYADHPVRKGDTWNRTVRRDDLYRGDLTYDYRCTLDDVHTDDGRTVATVTYRATVNRTPNGKPGTRLFGMLVRDVNGTIDGVATYDVERGAFVAQTEDINLSLPTLSDGTAPGETSNVDVTVRTKRTMRLLTFAERAEQRASNKAVTSE